MDKYGDGIPETTIALTNKKLGVKRTMLTSDDGIFTLPALTPGTEYDLKVTRRGYADWELPSFDLSVGETLNFKIRLYADKAATPEEAMRALAPVQDSKTSVTALVTANQLANLPTPLQRVDPLVPLSPAVVQNPEGTLIFRSLVARNVFLLDGNTVTNNYFLSSPGVAPFLSQEAVGEMQVIPAAPTADFTYTMGGWMNAVSKTGTNGLHASAYDYYGQNSWDSPDFFGNGFVPSGRYNRGGVNVGLPVIGDSLFLFGNLEHLNYSSEGMNRILNPLLTTPDGNSVLTSGCNTAIATAAQCSQAATFIGAQLNKIVPQTVNSTNGFARMDFRPGEHQTFSLEGAILSSRGNNNFDNATVATNGGMLGANANLTNSTRYGAFNWVDVIGESMVNNFHGAWFRDAMTTATNTAQFPVSLPGCLQCGTGPLGISVTGTSLGGNPIVPFDMREQRYQASDDFTFTLASHTVRIGGNVWRRQDTMDQLYARFGDYDYTSLTAFAQDFSANVRALRNYATFTQAFGSSTADTTDWFLSPFAEDVWKVKPGFTVVVGVRYDKARLPKPAEANPNNPYLTSIIPSPNTDVQPRIGLAYMLDNRTVVRIGGGSYYEPFPGQLLHDLYTGGGVFQTSFSLTPTTTGATVFPAVLPSSAVETLNSSLVNQFFSAERFRNPYTLQGTAAIERRLNRWVSLALSYIQSEGKRLWTATDINLVGSNSTSETYTINNAQGQAVSTFVTQVWNGAQAAHKYQVDNEGSSRYRAGVAQVRTAPFFGLTAQAAYTWSHAFDDMSGPPVMNTIVPQNYFPSSYAGDEGPAAFDARNHAVVNFTWQPVVHGTDVISRFLLNGWMVSGIGTYASSMYVTPIIMVQGQQFPTKNSVNTAITMNWPNTLNGTGGWSRVPWEPVNTLPLGSQFNIDARLSKTVPFTSRLAGTFTIDAFNLTDHRNVTAVNTIAFTSFLATISPVSGLGTPIASYGSAFGSTSRHLLLSFHVTW